jgi:hypothetical protein
MKLELKRIFYSPEYTVGKLYIDGVYYSDTLEDVVRDKDRDGDLDEPGEEKVFGKTAIPQGTYSIGYTYSPKFKKNMALIEGVDDFDGIRIHGVLPGVIATSKHTEGCILVGENKVKGGLINSAFYQKDINKKIGIAHDEFRTIEITIS